MQPRRFSSNQKSTTNLIKNDSRGTLYNIMTKERFGSSSIAHMCCHLASFCTVSAYLNTDILALRIFAVSGTLFITAFQYYRPQPLWLPMKWNALFLSVNLYMIAILLKEQYAADNLPREMNDLYAKGEFEERGFSKVQFMKFFELGVKQVFEDEHITLEGKNMDKLYYIVSGDATVLCSRNKQKLGTVESNQIIGEMAFLHYYENAKKDNNYHSTNASANVVANSVVRVWEWDYAELANLLKDDRDLSNAFISYCSHDLRSKLLSSNAEECADGKDSNIVEGRGWKKRFLTWWN